MSSFMRLRVGYALSNFKARQANGLGQPQLSLVRRGSSPEPSNRCGEALCSFFGGAASHRSFTRHYRYVKTTTTNHTVWLPLFSALALAGGCVASSSSAGDGSLTPENAWGDEAPPEAQSVSVDEFERQLADGEVKLVYPSSLEAERNAVDQAFRDNRERLQAASVKPDFVQRLLDQTEGVANHPGDPTLSLPSGGQVTLLGLGAQMADAAQALAKAQSVDNALADYRMTYALLPEDLKVSAESPDSLAGKSVDDVRSALAAIDQVLATSSASAMNRARPESESESASIAFRSAIVPASGAGSGGDADAVCSPTNYANFYWFPLKKFVSPMKQQARRGVCWAFAAIGALESRERVQNNNPVDLSEQFLVNKVKNNWAPSDIHEGGGADYALSEAVAKAQPIPIESTWVYNPSWSRTITETKTDFLTITSISNSCTGYTGTCSDTAHQSRLVCTDAAMKHCGYQNMTFSGASVPSSTTVQLWVSGQTFDIHRYEFLLNSGHVLLASFPVYDGFMNLPGAALGVVSDYKTEMTVGGKKVAGSYGDHVVQIVGYLPDEQLFIVKNSWGCWAGDAGYYYVPAEYVRTRFHHLSVLEFDDRRSDAWWGDQATPFAAPAIALRSASPRVDLRVRSDLVDVFTISHPVAKSVLLRVTSDRDGLLYNGGYSTAAALFRTLPVTFTSEGVRTITVSTRVSPSSPEATRSFALNVVNSPPQIRWNYGSAPVQDESFALTVTPYDMNEPDLSSLCGGATWSVDSPDVLSAASGCAQRITFKQAGRRQVRVTVRDREGLATSAVLDLDVQPPLVNPYPRIGNYGVYSRQTGGGLLRLCGNAAQTDGSTIDLRDIGCSILANQSTTQRYFARVTVENPDNESLTYEWKYFVRSGLAADSFAPLYGGSAPNFDLYSPGNAIPVTNDCYVSVTVHAPDPTRSKSLTVWTGRCTYNAARIN